MNAASDVFVLKKTNHWSLHSSLFAVVSLVSGHPPRAAWQDSDPTNALAMIVCPIFLVVGNYFLSITIHISHYIRQDELGPDSDLSIQLDVFDEQKLADDEELYSYYPDDGIDLNSPVECFQAIFKKVITLFLI